MSGELLMCAPVPVAKLITETLQPKDGVARDGLQALYGGSRRGSVAVSDHLGWRIRKAREGILVAGRLPEPRFFTLAHAQFAPGIGRAAPIFLRWDRRRFTLGDNVTVAQTRLNMLSG